MDKRIPFLIVGDAVDQPTGLSRILTDLATRIQAQFWESLDVATCGYVPWANIGSHGTELKPYGELQYQGYQEIGLRRWAFNDTRDWGASAINRAYRRWFQNKPGIIFTIWDPARCHGLLPLKMALPVEMWGYFAIDGENIHGTISGPAMEAVRTYDRVLAYNAYGAKVLAPICREEQAEAFTYAPAKVGVLKPGESFRLPAGEMKHVGIRHLPHGIDTDVFTPSQVPREFSIFSGVPRERTIIGCVATNQSRKDWGLVFQTLRYLRNQGMDVHLWAHTDRLVGEAWSLPQLQMDFDLTDRVTYTLELNDRDLAAAYSSCAVTIAPGRGEGHGYPIVESLCCGTPVVHGDYAGGRDILKGTVGGVLAEASIYHLVGPYAIRRPIIRPSEMASCVTIAMSSRRQDAMERGRTYGWKTVWPQWEQWVSVGVDRYLERTRQR